MNVAIVCLLLVAGAMLIIDALIFLEDVLEDDTSMNGTFRHAVSLVVGIAALMVGFVYLFAHVRWQP